MTDSLSTDRELIARFSAGSAQAALWERITARGQRVEALLPLPARPAQPLQHAQLQRVARALCARAAQDHPGTAPDALLAELRHAAERLNGDEQARLCELLLRGSDPRLALEEAADSLFSPEELALISSLRERYKPRALRLPQLWKAGADIDYGGYVCAIHKVTRQCNLRCTYCHDWRTGPESRMPFAVLAHSIAKLLHEYSKVDFVWHGGEPTLIGIRGFLRILTLQRLFVGTGQTLSNSLQTNGTTIDRSWADFFSDFDFQVNVSLDGPPELHGRTRPLANGRSSYAQVRRGLGLLREYGLARSVLMVVGPELVEFGAPALVSFLQEEQLLSAGLLPVRPGNPPGAGSQPYLPIERYVEFLIDVHRARLKSSGPWVRVREIDELHARVNGGIAAHCEFLGNCVGHFYSIEAGGEVGHCDKFLGDPNYTLGNVLSDEFAAMRSAAPACHAREEAESSRERMYDCAHFEKCRGWCPHERYVAQRTALGVKARCCGLGPLFDALVELGPGSSP